MAVVRKEALERTQAETKLVVVAEPALDIAVQADRVAMGGAEFVGCALALQSPGGVVAIDPKVDDVDG